MNQSWIFNRRTDAKAETPLLWSPDVKNWLIGKDPDAGKDWRQKEKGMTEDEMVAWHHWLKGHKFKQALEAVGQRGLRSCSPPGHKESDTTDRLNWNELIQTGEFLSCSLEMVKLGKFTLGFIISLKFSESWYLKNSLWKKLASKIRYLLPLTNVCIVREFKHKIGKFSS